MRSRGRGASDELPTSRGPTGVVPMAADPIEGRFPRPGRAAVRSEMVRSPGVQRPGSWLVYAGWYRADRAAKNMRQRPDPTTSEQRRAEPLGRVEKSVDHFASGEPNSWRRARHASDCSNRVLRSTTAVATCSTVWPTAAARSFIFASASSIVQCACSLTMPHAWYTIALCWGSSSVTRSVLTRGARFCNVTMSAVGDVAHAGIAARGVASPSRPCADRDVRPRVAARVAVDYDRRMGRITEVVCSQRERSRRGQDQFYACPNRSHALLSLDVRFDERLPIAPVCRPCTRHNQPRGSLPLE
jgi:hypothetical protein